MSLQCWRRNPWARRGLRKSFDTGSGVQWAEHSADVRWPAGRVRTVNRSCPSTSGDDLRLTGVRPLTRPYKLDELLQLINVLMGNI